MGFTSVICTDFFKKGWSPISYIASSLNLELFSPYMSVTLSATIYTPFRLQHRSGCFEIAAVEIAARMDWLRTFESEVQGTYSSQKRSLSLS